eukprot:Hpha_TRINITY_DN3676_c0_g1::TRINITY_DN3676_c0_g1_i1::g.1033::m.1033
MVRQASIFEFAPAAKRSREILPEDQPLPTTPSPSKADGSKMLVDSPRDAAQKGSLGDSSCGITPEASLDPDVGASTPAHQTTREEAAPTPKRRRKAEPKKGGAKKKKESKKVEEEAPSDSESEGGGLMAKMQQQKARNLEFLESLGIERLAPPPKAKKMPRLPKKEPKPHVEDPNDIIRSVMRERDEARANGGVTSDKPSNPMDVTVARVEDVVERGDLPLEKVDQSEAFERVSRGIQHPEQLPARGQLTPAKLASSKMRGAYRMTRSRIFRIAMHPTEPLMACGSVSGEVGFVDMRTHETYRCSLFSRAARTVHFQQNTTNLLTCTDEGLVRRFTEDRQTWEEVLFSEQDSLEGLAQPCGSPEELWVATTLGDVLSADLRTKGITGRFDASDGRVYNVNAHPLDKNKVLTNSVTGEAKIWDVRRPKEAFCTIHHHRAVADVAFSDSGNRVLTSSWDQTVRMWDVTSPEPKSVGKVWSHYNETGRFLTKLTVRFLPGSESVCLHGSRGKAAPKGCVESYDFEKAKFSAIYSQNETNATCNTLAIPHRSLPLFASSFSTGSVAIWY